jgi:hypothetical protein
LCTNVVGRELVRESIETVLPAVRIPVHVLSGDADELTPRWHPS